MNNIIINKNLIEDISIKSENIKCGCYHCLSIFPLYKISEWDISLDDNAICPYCGNNSVITTLNYKDINKDILKDTKHRWAIRSSEFIF